jgi:hypothetical protein
MVRVLDVVLIFRTLFDRDDSLVYRYFFQTCSGCLYSIIAQTGLGCFHVVNGFYLVECVLWYLIAESAFRKQYTHLGDILLQERRRHMSLILIMPLQVFVAFYHRAQYHPYLCIIIILVAVKKIHPWCGLLLIGLVYPFGCIILLTLIITVINIWALAVNPTTGRIAAMGFLGLISTLTQWILPTWQLTYLTM